MQIPTSSNEHGCEYSNETIRLLNERASLRNFSTKPVTDDVLDEVLSAGLHSASGGNLQPFSVIVVRDTSISSKLAELCEGQAWIASAPLNLLFCIDFHRLERMSELHAAPFTCHKSFRHFWISFQDTVIAAQSICTAADSLGLGSVYIGTVLECFRELKSLFELPRLVFPVVLLSLGYPEESRRMAPKLNKDAVVHMGKYRHIPDDELEAMYNEKYSAFVGGATDEKVATIRAVCRTVGGGELEEKAMKRIAEKSLISIMQFYFGLHYRADDMQQNNAEFFQIIREFGFEWFEPK